MYFVYLLVFVLFCFNSLGTGNATKVKLKCSEETLNFYVDGVHKGSATNTKNSIKEYTIPDTTKVVGIKCESASSGSTSVRAGILASFNTEYEGDYFTDSTWRCNSGYFDDWNKPEFDDSGWSYAATSLGNNEDKDGLTADSSLPNFIKWIWTTSNTGKSMDEAVYCRGYPKIPQTYDSYGRRFVIAFMQNKPNSKLLKEIRLMFTTLSPTDVTVYCKTPRLASSDSRHEDFSLTIRAGEVKQQIVDRMLRHQDTEISNLGIRCDATEPVKIIGLNQEKHSTDMCLMIPLTSLGKETEPNIYYAVVWDDSSKKDARVVIAAGYDNTVVTVKGKQDFTYKGKSQPKGADIKITLALKYQTVQLSCEKVGFTGTKITSTKPIVVYSGNQKAEVIGDGSGTSQDHLVEQLQPTMNYGTHFILTPLPFGSDKKLSRVEAELTKYKYIAAEDNTVISIKRSISHKDDKGPWNLNEGDYVDDKHTRGSYAIVTSTKGIQVAQFATTKGKSNYLGDPWLQMIPPSRQFSRDYGLLTPELDESTDSKPKHFVTIIVDKDEKDGIRVNGNAIDWKNAVEITSENKIYINYEISYSATSGQRVEHVDTSVSFAVYFFGYGYLDSYATMGGSRMAPINGPCAKTTATSFGDGLDNDCDGKIDEDPCTSASELQTKDCALPEPVNGGWSDWSTQGVCSDCVNNPSTAKQLYKRTCDKPVPKYNGWPCSGSDTKEESCQCVKVDGGWGDWKPWGQCNKDCGNGERIRERKCTNPEPSEVPKGDDCDPKGSTETETCKVKECPIDGGWSDWQNNGNCVCGVKSGDGNQNQDRTCTKPEPKYNGLNCSGDKTRKIPCKCKLDGAWANWQSWGDCSTTCGLSKKERIRTCTDPAPANGGANCTGNNTEKEVCNVVKCPINGGWNDWQNSTQCVCGIKSGNGHQNQTRSCTKPEPKYNGLNCSGDKTNQIPCKCKLDGEWATWQSWGDCSKTCGDGQRQRIRTCTDPAPANGGANCTGNHTLEQESCKVVECPINGGWGDWQNNGNCVCGVKSGDGLQNQTRTCTNPEPKYNGLDCSGDTKQQNPCKCKLDGEWATWQSWGDCSKTCGDGQRQRIRTCTDPAPANGGANCTGNHTLEQESCKVVECPINGGWGDWQNNGNCVCGVKSGDGLQNQTRTCTNPEPKYNGLDCSGDKKNRNPCKCKLDGEWATWQSWGDCSKTCGDGQRERIRTCTDPAPANGGADCTGNLNAEQENCKVVECPIAGGWGEWTDGQTTCSDNNPIDGLLEQLRQCDNPKPQHGGDDCIGDKTQQIYYDCIKDILGDANTKLYEFKRDMTCTEEKKNHQDMTLTQCGTKCNEDSACYAFLFDQLGTEKCTFFSECTPKESTDKEVLFTKTSFTTPKNDLNINGAGAQGADADNAAVVANTGVGIMLPIILGAVGALAVGSCTVFMLIRRYKKKKEEEKPKTGSSEANDMEAEDIEGGVDNNGAEEPKDDIW